MLRTISIKLQVSSDGHIKLRKLQEKFSQACNLVANYARSNRCWNQKNLHHLCYYKVRQEIKIGSQMVCNAIRKACGSYKVLKTKKSQKVPKIIFKTNSSIHFDKRVYSIDQEIISLYTLSKRIKAKMVLGNFQKDYLKYGYPKEAELIYRNNNWFFNLVLEFQDKLKTKNKIKKRGKILGVDLGENNLAAVSTGKIFSGNKLRHDRDCKLALRRRLQSRGPIKN